MAASVLTVAQTPAQKEMEKDLRRESVLSFSSHYYDVHRNEDSLFLHNHLFAEKLRKYLAGDASTLAYVFPQLTDSNDLQHADSKDGLFRIYSWDKRSGGTTHFFENIYQYKADGKVYVQPLTLAEDDPSGIYSDVLTVKTAANTYYIAMQTGIYSSKDFGKRLRAFAIEHHVLNDSVKLFKGYRGFVNLVDIGSGLFPNDDDRGPEMGITLAYDPLKRLIFIPEIIKNDKIIHNYRLYRFTGVYFERVYPE
jgi:hypothetical protein